MNPLTMTADEERAMRAMDHSFMRPQLAAVLHRTWAEVDALRAALSRARAPEDERMPVQVIVDTPTTTTVLEITDRRVVQGRVDRIVVKWPPALSHALEAGRIAELESEVADLRRRLLSEGDADIAEAEVARLKAALGEQHVPSVAVNVRCQCGHSEWQHLRETPQSPRRECDAKGGCDCQMFRPASPAARPETAERDKAVMALGEYFLKKAKTHLDRGEHGYVEINPAVEPINRAINADAASRSPAAPEATQENDNV